jgi:hypothetical protein
VVGPILFIWLIFSIYHQIEQQKNLPHTWQNIINNFSVTDSWKLCLVFVLMFVNWGLEAKKWQLLVNTIQPINFLRAFRAIFSGQAFALNTINGVGEYVGRIVFLNEGNRLRAIAISVVGSFSQLIVTFVMGFFGLLYMRIFLLNSNQEFKGLSVFWFDALMWGLLIANILFIMLYFSLSWVTKMFERIPFVSKYAYFIKEVENLQWRELTRILNLSFIRYVVFVAQYLLLLQIFKVDADWFSLAWLVCVMFLILAIVPTITLAELGLRGELSIQLIGLVSINTIGILFTATGIWLINKVIPALVGSLFILGVRIFKK